MSGLIAVAVPLLTVAAIVVSMLVLVQTRSAAAALPVLLDLLLAVGLLRLSATATWDGIASAALIVAIRTLAIVGPVTRSAWGWGRT